MKFRKDFVTNSSSSSFICDICGNSEGGFDISLSDCDMSKCVHGHVVCDHHLLEMNLTKEEMVKTIIENEWNRGYDYDKRAYRDYTEEELMEYTKEELFDEWYTEGGHYDLPEEMCPICQFHEYLESDFIRYMCRKHKVTYDEINAALGADKNAYIRESEQVGYLCHRFNILPREAMKIWREEFKSYDEFCHYINNTVDRGKEGV